MAMNQNDHFAVGSLSQLSWSIIFRCSIPLSRRTILLTTRCAFLGYKKVVFIKSTGIKSGLLVKMGGVGHEVLEQDVAPFLPNTALSKDISSSKYETL